MKPFLIFLERDPNRPPPPKTTGKLEFEYFGDRNEMENENGFSLYLKGHFSVYLCKFLFLLRQR